VIAASLLPKRATYKKARVPPTMGPLPDDVSTSIPSPDQPWGGQTLPTRTSGLAIASFVLSLVWIFGLGSLLAVIFAIVARKDIKRSRGTKGGKGFARAGLVIGILGLIGAAVVFAGSVAMVSGAHQAVKQATTPKVLPLGTTANVTAADGSGIKSVTVLSIKYPVNSDGHPRFHTWKRICSSRYQSMCRECRQSGRARPFPTRPFIPRTDHSFLRLFRSNASA
jgi:hypothetical protein